MISELMDMISSLNIRVKDREKLYGTIKKLALLSQCKSSSATHDKKLYRELLSNEEIQKLINNDAIYAACINEIRRIIIRKLGGGVNPLIIEDLWLKVKIPSRPVKAAIITYIILKSNNVNVTMTQASKWFNVSLSTFRKWIKKYNYLIDPPRGAVTCQEMRK